VTVGQHPHSMGASLNSNRILWHSDSSKDDADDHGYYEYEDEYGFWHKRQRSYLAQLDNDGSITIYSVWNVQKHENDNDYDRREGRKKRRNRRSRKGRRDNDEDDGGTTSYAYYYNAISDKSTQVRNKAWMTAKDIWHGRVPVNDEYDHLYYYNHHHNNNKHDPSQSPSPFPSSSSSVTYKRCIYSTSKVIGCNRTGRKITEVSLELYFRISRTILKLNQYADSWLDLILEEDDLLRSLKESVLKNGRGSISAGTKAIASSAKFVRKLIQLLIVRIKEQHFPQ